MTKLASTLPEGGHGLETIQHKLVAKPKEQHVVIGIVDCQKVTTDHEKGSVEPTARMRRLELATTTDLDMAHQLLIRSLDSRLGATVLPLAIEDDIAAAFGTPSTDVNPDDDAQQADADEVEIRTLDAELRDAIEELRKLGLFKFGRARRVLSLARRTYEINDEAEMTARAG